MPIRWLLRWLLSCVLSCLLYKCIHQCSIHIHSIHLYVVLHVVKVTSVTCSQGNRVHTIRVQNGDEGARRGDDHTPRGGAHGEGEGSAVVQSNVVVQYGHLEALLCACAGCWHGDGCVHCTVVCAQVGGWHQMESVLISAHTTSNSFLSSTHSSTHPSPTHLGPRWQCWVHW